jgi:alkane 1-monooxygenase
LKVKALKYTAAYFTPIVLLLSLHMEGWGTYSGFLILFGIIPLIELYLNPNTDNLTSLEEEIAKDDAMYDWLLYSMVGLQYLLLTIFLIKVSEPGRSPFELMGLVVSYGLACGVLGINVAHELGHRSTKHEQLMSKILLLSSMYMHFFIEHNKGHHKNVATLEDPATSRLGESVYRFYARTIWGSWISAWQIESKRLKKINKPILSFYNEMMIYQWIQGAFLIIIGIFFGMKPLVCFIVGSFIGIILLETVNYIEHYGLLRDKKGDFYSQTQPRHSWNSNHPLGRLLLFELSRHSDHHYMSNRKYQILRHHDESPQMPTGYPGMMLLSLIPPLWFNIMDKKVMQIR